MDFKNNIPSFDILRHEYVGRYVAFDPYMIGECRFAFCEGEKECVFKQANIAKTTTDLNIDDIEIQLNTKIIGCIVDSYIKINNKFYLVKESYQDKLTVEQIKENVKEGTEIELYSVPVYASRKGKCCSIKFGITTIHVNGIDYTIKDTTTIEDVLEYFSSNTICCYENDLLYFNGEGYSENTYYKNSNEFPIESKLLSIQSTHKIANGDEILLFNEDIRGNLTINVKKCKLTNDWNGYNSVIYVDKLDSDYLYAQLRAYSAYFSKEMDLGNVKPFVPDICYATTFGEESIVEKGFILHNNDRKLNSYPIDLKYIPNVKVKPTDLIISMNVTYGKLNKAIPKVIFECDANGIFQFKINTIIKENFVFKFDSTNDCKLSIMDFDGNIEFTGNINSTVKASLHERTFTFKSLPNSKIEFSYFNFDGTIADKIEYYFIAKNKNNSRIEVNGLHLNQLLKPYEELLAIIGESSVGEGRIAL